jgi:hypothetical protein
MLEVVTPGVRIVGGNSSNMFVCVRVCVCGERGGGGGGGSKPPRRNPWHLPQYQLHWADAEF